MTVLDYFALLLHTQDLRGLVHGKNLPDSWSTIENVLRQLSGLKWLDFGLVPTWILHQVTESLPE